jgi:SAM-dependent methyltransferase
MKAVFGTILSVIFILGIGCNPKPNRVVEVEGQDSLPVNDLRDKATFDELVQQFEDPDRDSWQKPGLVIEMLGVQPDEWVADIGAGTGYFTFPIADQAGKVIAIDIDKRMLEFMDEKKIQDSVYNVETRRTKDYDPLLLSNEVDAVLMVNTFHHIEDRVAYLNRVRRGIKPGGRILIVDFKKEKLPVGPPSGRKLSADQITEDLESSGFSNLKVDSTALPYQIMYLGYHLSN